jgi:TolB-like protein
MKGKSIAISLFSVLLCMAPAFSSWAGQIVTDETRLWAKEALQKEKTLKTTSASKTLAVLYFHNKTGWSKLDLIQKGLTIMLMTDLSKVKEIQLVERVKLQALLEELDLGVSGLVESENSSRMGRLLGASLLVGGDIVKEKSDEFGLKSGLLSVPTEQLLGKPTARGKLLAELFRMEKNLLFQIIKLLKIELSPALQSELREPMAASIDALLYLFEGIENSDQGDYGKAADSYGKALEEDPSLVLAIIAIREIYKKRRDEGAEEKKEPPPPPRKPCAAERNKFIKNFRR